MAACRSETGHKEREINPHVCCNDVMETVTVAHFGFEWF